jgi:hypothetical protein
MSARRMDMLDIRELIRQLQAGQSNRQIGRAMHVSRVTVKKYRAWAVAHDLINRPLVSPEEVAHLLAQDQLLHPTVKASSSLEPYRALVTDLRQRGVEMMAIYQRLRDEHGFTGTYSSVRRFVHNLEPAQPDATIRIERQPGDAPARPACGGDTGRGSSRFWLRRIDAGRGRPAAAGVGLCDDAVVQSPSIRRIRL